MDPNAALKQMVEAFARGDRDEGLDRLDGLRTWLMGGGFVPEEAAIKFVGEPDRRVLVKAEDVPDGVDFCKEHGDTWYRRISQSSMKNVLETGYDDIYGVTDYGSMTQVSSTKKVWVLPPLDWELMEPWCELMTQYAGYDPDDPERHGP
jgi:hypothetical protein